MHRTLPNILFILILFFLATAFPLSMDILSIDLSQKIVDKPVEEIVIEPEFSTILPTGDDSIANTMIAFDIESSTSAFPNDFLNGYAIVISQHDKVVNSLPLNSLTYEIIDANAKTKTINVAKSILTEGLEPGYYTCVLSFEEQPFEHQWYLSNLNYDKTLLKTGNQLNAKQLNLTLFYPTYDYKNVIPITRHVPESKNRFRTLYTALVNGPKAGIGLYEGIPSIPNAPNIKISKKIATVFIYSKDLIGFEDKFPVVADAISKSFLSQGTVTGVNFLIDEKSTNTTLGVDLKQTFTPSTLNNAYIGYTHASPQMLLMPVPLKTATLDERIAEAWSIMTSSNGDSSALTSDMIQSIPDELAITDYQLEGTVLTLNLSKAIPETVVVAPEYLDLMIKSILYTYGSFPEVDAIKINVAGSPLILGPYDFTQPLKADLYINLEP